MKRWRVVTSRVEYYRGEIVVEAKNAREAETAARDELGTDDYELTNAEEQILSVKQETS